MACYSSLICYPSVCTLMSVLAAEWNRRRFGRDAGFGFCVSVCVLGPVGASRELCHDCVVDAFTV